MGQKWPDCDAKIKAFLNDAVRVFRDIVPQKLDAVILHGSLAMGAFYPPKSDLDLLILISSPLNSDENQQIYHRLVRLTDKRPIVGFLELSVVQSIHALQPRHPIPYELHFGEEFPGLIRNGNFDYGNAAGTDPDLAAHFTVARNRGISLYGPSPKLSLGEISWQDYMDSVLDDLNWILDEGNILSTPVYAVLNCCRVLEMLRKGEGTVSSKEEGALWALDTLPEEHHDLVRFALECYQSNQPVAWDQLRKAGVEWPESQLVEFGEYVRKVVDEWKTNDNHVLTRQTPKQLR